MSVSEHPTETMPGDRPLGKSAPPTPEEAFSVVIAGGGVAALEAVLALSQESASTSVELICPSREFALRPLSVGQPFGSAPARRLDLAEFCWRNDATLRIDKVAEVWGGQRRVLLDTAEELFYDALLLAPGARPYDALPGAHAFGGPDDVDWFGELVDRLEHGRLRRLCFAVPAEVRWALPLYELALMTARQVGERGVHSAEISFVTHEETPLADLGESAGERIRQLLDEAGVGIRCGVAPQRFDADQLLLEDGSHVDAAEVVCLPALRVPEIPGIQQGRHGFIPTDAAMRVEGLDRVWAAGDATWFPIKQGGIAAQQADIVAADIARSAGGRNEVPALSPIVRGALLTGDEPEFFRVPVAIGTQSEGARFPLWWPPGKVAGKWLAPYLAREWSGRPTDPLVPLEDLGGEDATTRAEQHRSAVDLSLHFAELDAQQGDFAQALRWLDIAEKLNVTLPPDYVTRRADWLEILRSRKR